MGAWGVSPFENDEAMDWVGGLLDRGDPAIVRDALTTVTQIDANEYVDVTTASEGLAAAAVVAAALGESDVMLPDELPEWIASHLSALRAEQANAARAVERIVADSELAELFRESQSADDWLQELRRLLSVLSPR